MKNTLTPLLLSISLLCCASAASGQVRFGLKAGFNLANMSLSDDYSLIIRLLEGADGFETKWLPVYHAGAVVEFGIGGNFGISTGAQLSVKGAKLEFNGRILNAPYTRTYSIRPAYLHLPLALTFRSDGFYAGMGPYIGYAVAGKEKIKTKSDGTSSSSSEDLNFGSDAQDDLSPLDYGAGLELGYEFGNLRASASYNMGLANILPKDLVDEAASLDGDWWAKNRVIGVSLTYFLGSE